MISTSKMKFWIEKGYNVLFEGRHGVGKTACVIEAFKEAGLQYRYFSAATMDPWVDFVGVPKEQKREDKPPVLTLIRPQEFEDDTVEAIFFDEFNRAPKKVRNAVMELLQFKSINGRKFNNLRLIWAAINPADNDVYDVEQIDPAQQDRFHIHVMVPYAPSFNYFKNRYGPDYADAAIKWWNTESKAVQNAVSPRRLDYALDIYTENGSISDVLPKEANSAKLLEFLKKYAFKSEYETLLKLFEKGEFEKVEKILSDENLFNTFVPQLKEANRLKDFIEYFPEEKIASLISSESEMLEWVVRNEKPKFTKVLNPIVQTGGSLAKQIEQFRKELSHYRIDKYWGIDVEEVKQGRIKSRAQGTQKDISPQLLSGWKIQMEKNTYNRRRALEEICDELTFQVDSDDMSHKTLGLLLLLMKQFTEKSYDTTLQKNKDLLVEILKTLFHQYVKRDAADMEQLVGYSVLSMWHNLKGTGIYRY